MLPLRAVVPSPTDFRASTSEHLRALTDKRRALVINVRKSFVRWREGLTCERVPALLL
jgi:hypothetical protein